MQPEQTPKKPARLFIGFSVPEKVKDSIHTALSQYGKYLEFKMPEDNWHVVLLVLGEIPYYHGYLSRIVKLLPQAFLPTLTVTHIGRGYTRDELWAVGHSSPVIVAMKNELERRMRKMRFPMPETLADFEYAPHINLGNFFPVVRGMGVPDEAVNVTFPIKEAYLYEIVEDPDGVRYEVVGTIPLS